MQPLLCIDSKIKLSNSHKNLLEDNFSVKEIDISKPDMSLLKECEFFILHSFLSCDLLRSLTKCRYIGIRAHNLDYVDLNLAKELGIVVEGIEAVAQQSVAEHTFSLIFALSKNLIISNENVISSKWRNDLPMNMELYEKRLGIIGYGEIGKRVGQIGRALNMDVVIAQKPSGGEGMPLDEVLKTSDIITLHIPSKDSNRLFMDEEKIQKMKQGSILINTSRGAILDYKAAEKAIKEGHLGGLGLDVFEKEPLDKYNFSRNLNVICTPHVAYNTYETLQRMNIHVIKNTISYYKSHGQN